MPGYAATSSARRRSRDQGPALPGARIEAEWLDLSARLRRSRHQQRHVLRPSCQALLEAARLGRFEVVFAEALDRLSRDQEYVVGLLKRPRFAGIRLLTQAENEITELHIGLKGIMNALFL